MKYPLFLSDFDGTLVRADGTISKRNVEAVAAYRKRGGIFAVVTGRMLSSIRPRLKELGLSEGIVAAYQGAVIADIATGRLLKNAAFEPERAARILSALEEKGLHLHVYADETLYCNRDDEYLRVYERICGVKGVVENQPLSRLVLARGMRATKILAMIDPRERTELLAESEERFGEEASVTASSEMLVEFLPKGETKAGAVVFLSKRYGIPIERVAAIGDQLNDAPMIEAAGGKFAVANAAEELKKLATVVPSVREDGVAVAIEKYAMGEEE